IIVPSTVPMQPAPPPPSRSETPVVIEPVTKRNGLLKPTATVTQQTPPQMAAQTSAQPATQSPAQPAMQPTTQPPPQVQVAAAPPRRNPLARPTPANNSSGAVLPPADFRPGPIVPLSPEAASPYLATVIKPVASTHGPAPAQSVKNNPPSTPT